MTSTEAPETVEVCLGKRRMTFPGARHWALKVGDRWYEIDREDKYLDGFIMRVGEHTDDSRYEKVRTLATVPRAEAEAKAAAFNKRWAEARHRYQFMYRNCQDYVSLFAKEYGSDLVTQRARVVDAMMKGADGAAVVGTLAAGCALLLAVLAVVLRRGG